MNVTPALFSAALAAPPAAITPAANGGSPGALAARDLAMPGLADATASTTGLQSLAAALGASSTGSSAAAASSVAAPAPPLPSAVDHGSHDETALHEDLGTGDPAPDPSEPAVSA